MRTKNVNDASQLSKFLYFFGAIQMISCPAHLVTMDETLLYHYVPETKKNQWNGSIALHPTPPQKKSLEQKSAGKIHASIFLFGSRRHTPH